MDKEKELFTYCTEANTSVKELDKYDLSILLSSYVKGEIINEFN